MLEYKLKHGFKELERTLIKNVANSLLQLEFHLESTQEKLEEYYGGGISRDDMIDDTLKRLDSEQFILKFYKENKANIIEKYGNENAIGDLGLTIQRPSGTGTEQGSGDQSTGGDGEGGPEQSADNDTGLGDDATESDHSDEQTEGDAGDVSSRPDETEQVSGDDQRGEHEGGKPKEQGATNW